jgi:DNA (cytosine-5)-methyltransferase 1
MTLSALSLFSGCMGLDLGCESAGVMSQLAVERDSACRATIARNRPNMPCLGDITQVTGAQVRRLIGPVDAIIGGPPCQSFSFMGKRRSFADPRGQLMYHYIRLVGELKPRFFAMENVVGLLHAEVRPGQPVLDWLLQEFAKLGYNTGWWKLDASHFGSPQKRQRLIVLGNRKGPVYQPEPCRPHIESIGGLIESIENSPGECGKFAPKVAHFLRKIPEGQNWRALSLRDRKAAMGNADPKSGGLVGYYRRLSYNRPSPTLLTCPTQKATMLCHPSKTRPLSVREYARIQGMPETWELKGSTSDKYRQLGNAVPVPLGAAVGQALVRMGV